MRKNNFGEKWKSENFFESKILDQTARKMSSRVSNVVDVFIKIINDTEIN